MSEYWSATSGTALVFPKEEVRDFFTRYLLETYRKDGVTDRDIDFIDCTISEYGSDSFYFLRSAYRQSLLEDFHSLESCVNERAAAEHKKELFNCVEYCEEEHSGGVLIHSKSQPAVSLWMWKMVLISSTLTSLHARRICLEMTGISPLRKSSKNSRKNLRHTCLMISIGSLISDFSSVHLSRKTVF